MSALLPADDDDVPVDDVEMRSRWIRSALTFTYADMSDRAVGEQIPPVLRHGWDGIDMMEADAVPPRLRGAIDSGAVYAWVVARSSRVRPDGTRDTANASWAMAWPTWQGNRVLMDVLIKYRASEPMLFRSEVRLPDVAEVRGEFDEDRIRVLAVPESGPDIGAREWEVVSENTAPPSPLAGLMAQVKASGDLATDERYSIDSGARTLFARGKAALEDGHTDQARRLFEQVLATGDPCVRGYAMLLIADALATDGRRAEAAVAYQRAADMSVTDASQLGRYYAVLRRSCLELSEDLTADVFGNLIAVMPPPNGAGGLMDVRMRIGEVIRPGTRAYMQKIEALRSDVKDYAEAVLGEQSDAVAAVLLQHCINAFAAALKPSQNTLEL